MVILIIDLKVKKGKTGELTENFYGQFLPVVSGQPGFCGAELVGELETSLHMLILLYFETEQQRLDWVASPQHDPAWNSIADLCESNNPIAYRIITEPTAQEC